MNINQLLHFAAADEIERLEAAAKGERVLFESVIAEARERIDALEADNARLRAALADMIEISQRNSEATLMLLAIRKCARHALEQKP